ncbi:SDR family NAD(P)-dependent oxidoreductase [Pseudonocardiaceae bacterium YIM PH 21723]|nr:SDR family NAD(P)-dependent oxidoreductase [Pseudonocardiaceae bacterium YIM PH 21723]
MTTVLITGATDGLGRGLALQLANEGVSLIVHGRNEEKLAALTGELGALGARPQTVLADLSELAQVARLAEQIEHIDVLVNNAGIGFGLKDGRQESRDGYELRFAVNYLASFLLAEKLLPVLRAAGGTSRIVQVASAGQFPLDFDDLMLSTSYDPRRAYRQSKLAQIMHGFDLAARLPAAEITVNSLHPGSLMPTQMVLKEGVDPMDTIESGIAAIHQLVVGVEGVTGEYFHQLQPGKADPQAYDLEARATLRARTLELVGAYL